MQNIKSGRTDVSTVVGMSLLLFLLGVFGYVMFMSYGLENRIKEQLQVDIMFRDNVQEVDILMMEKELAAKEMVVSATYVSVDSAKALMMRMFGDDGFDLLGYNPINANIVVRLTSSYVNADSALAFKKALMEGNEHMIEEVSYNEAQFAEINSGIFSTAEIIVVGLAFLLLFVTMALINNTIRLAIYAKRFTIKTMQLVGAKPSFIRKPFLIKALGIGFIAAVIAIILLIITGMIFANFLPESLVNLTQSEQHLQQELKMFAYLFTGILFLGIFVSWISTYFALSKYIWIRTEKLY